MASNSSMASKSQDSQNPDPNPTQSHLPFTSITLSLSLPKFLPTHFISSPTPPKIIPTTLKIPSQISSILNLSLSSSLPITKPSSNPTPSSNPLPNPLSFTPLPPSHPPNAAALRRISVVLFRHDLRLHDNEALVAANNESISVLPVYCFDPNEFRNKTGPNRAGFPGFLIESVTDLRKSLQSRGSDLVIRIGNPEKVLAELVKEIGADGVYMHKEVSNEGCKVEVKIENVLKDEGVEVKYFWGSTLYHVEDLPFKLEEMPTDYGGFRERVKGVKVRNMIEVVDQMKGLPCCGNVEIGEIPSLADLGVNPTASMTQVKPVINGPLVGGETEALNRLKRFATECQAQPPKESKDGNNDSVYGASFSCKISPWLAMGCISPRVVFDELKKSTSRTISAGLNRKDGGDSGMNWLMYELLWRDFFRFITRKYSSSKQHNQAPVAA